MISSLSNLSSVTRYYRWIQLTPFRHQSSFRDALKGVQREKLTNSIKTNPSSKVSDSVVIDNKTPGSGATKTTIPAASSSSFRSLRQSYQMAENSRQVKQDSTNSGEPKPKQVHSSTSSPSLDAIRQDVLSSVTSQSKTGSNSVSSLEAIPEVEADEVTDGELRYKQKQQKHDHKKIMLEKKYGDAFNPNRVEVAVPVFSKNTLTSSTTTQVNEKQREIETLRKSVSRSINMADALQALGALEPTHPSTGRAGPVPIEPKTVTTQVDESISSNNEKLAADRRNGPVKISSTGPVPIESPALDKKTKRGTGDLTPVSEFKQEVQKTGPRPILVKEKPAVENEEPQQDRPVRSHAKEKRREDAGKKKGFKENNAPSPSPSPVLDIREQKRLFQERIQQQKEQQQQQKEQQQQEQQARQQQQLHRRQQFESNNNQERFNNRGQFNDYNRGQYNNGPRQPMRTFLQEHQAEVAKKTKENKGTAGTVVKEVLIPSDGLTVKEVSQRFSMRVQEVIGKLVELGELDAGALKKGKGKVRGSRLKRKKASAGATSQEEVHIDADVMELLALEFGLNSRRVNSKIQDLADNSDHDFLTAARREVAEEGLVRRPAMVTIMGHVDHGKTTLLDSLRRLDMTTNSATSSSSSSGAKNKSSKQQEQSPTVESIAEHEAGGITQKLSAFSVTLPPREVAEGEESGSSEERRIVMVDTPGHAAFTSMRSMGATSTDIVILLISMESGIQPQTAECLTLIQKNQLPVVIAVNKVDKYSAAERTAALNKINNTLASRFNILTTDYGGHVPIVPISAKTGYNLPLLVEAVQSLCSGEVLKQHDATIDESVEEEGEDLSGLNSLRRLQKRLYVLEEGEAEGIVLDSYLEKGRGVVTNLVTSWGRLAVGDNIIIGTTYGKVRALYNENNKPISYATPGTIVKVIGLKDLPPIGEELITVESESDAKTISDRRKRLNELKEARRQAAISSAIRAGSTTTASASAAAQSEEDVAPIEEKVVKVVLKADSVGSLEALKFIVSSIAEAAKEHHIDVKVIHQQVGDVLVSDVELAGTASTTGEGHLILAFNVGAKDQQTRQLSKQLDVDIQSNDIIYRLEEELIHKIEEYLPKEEHIEREVMTYMR